MLTWKSSEKHRSCDPGSSWSASTAENNHESNPMQLNEETQVPMTLPEEVDMAFLEDLMARLVGSTIVAISPYSETQFYIATERDGVATQVMLSVEDGELVLSEGVMESEE